MGPEVAGKTPSPTSDEEGHDVNVLITGPTGNAGAAVADVLLAAGHRVSDLARSENSAGTLKKHALRL